MGRHGAGIRTRVLLLTSLVLIVAATTAASLYVIRSRLRHQVRTNLEEDLQHSVETFQDLEAGRLAALRRENALMAALPSLKALMTTNDARTIADDAVEFWKTSGTDLFALAGSDKRIVAVEARDVDDAGARERLRLSLQNALAVSSTHYLLSDGRLFEYSVQPLYFGSEKDGTLLGYVIEGFVIDRGFLTQVGRGAGAEAAFVSGDRTLISPFQDGKAFRVQALPLEQGAGATTLTGGERYLIAAKDLTDGAAFPLKLVVMKSLQAAERSEGEINRLVLLVGLLAILAGSMLMTLLAQMVTRPLELLARGVRAFGAGDLQHSLPSGGTQEVRLLSQVFARMRDEIQKTNRQLLESERLATIGRMASSVSHDLRHYLAAVYANAEFLASPNLPAAERGELFDEIRLAVNGTTDMLDDLLIFSRTGSSLHRIETTMTSLVERTVALARSHPDAQGVTVRVEKVNAETTAAVDTKQVERALYNLLLNACQSARESAGIQEVEVLLSSDAESVSVTILDSGPGVAEGIRGSLFDPFVSEGKQKGTGLGLTLASSVAREHGGEVTLISSRGGETIFRLTVARHLNQQCLHGASSQVKTPGSQVLTS